MRLRRAAARLAHDHRGISLSEVMVTAGLLLSVTAIFLPVMASVQSGVERQSDRSTMNDDLRQAMEQLDREIRSGNLIYDPSIEPDIPEGFSGFVLRIHTQTNATTRVPPEQCIRWRVKSNRLERQAYHVVGGAPVIISDWRSIAANIANKSVSPQVLPFMLDPSGRAVHVTLVSLAAGADSSTDAVHAETSVAIRNSSGSDPCTPVPTWN